MRLVIEWLSDLGHASYVVSSIAVFISTAAWVTAWRIRKRHLEIEEAREKDRAKQAKKAYLSAEIEKEQGTKSPRFYLRVNNQGLGTARDMKISLDEVPLSDHRSTPNCKEPPTLGPNSSFRYQLVITLGIQGPQTINITWTDDSGEQGLYQSTLSL